MVKIFKNIAILEGISYLVLFANMLLIKPNNLELYKTFFISSGNDQWGVVHWLRGLGTIHDEIPKMEFRNAFNCLVCFSPAFGYLFCGKEIFANSGKQIIILPNVKNDFTYFCPFDEGKIPLVALVM